MADEHICFIVSPIGEPGTETRKRADQVLKHVFRPVAEKCGYKALRSDEIAEPGMISRQVIQNVLEAPMVIADLTGSNGNVFYELALRHAIKKPFVQLIEVGEKLPFDVADVRTIYLDHNDLDSAESARDELEKQIKAIEGKSPEQIDTPVTRALDIQSLRQSGDPELRSIGEFTEAVAQIRVELRQIAEMISEQVKRQTMSDRERDWWTHNFVKYQDESEIRRQHAQEKLNEEIVKRFDEYKRLFESYKNPGSA